MFSLSIATLDDHLFSVSSLYESIRSDLVSKSKDIGKIFNLLLRSEASAYSLTYVNSAYPGYYFSFSNRVKTVESLEEKLVRSGQILHMIDKKEEDLIKDFSDMDDLIGIKILGEVEQDVKSIFKCLRENKTFLESKGIFLLSDLTEQPDTMKNGLEIFKINCEYKFKEGSLSRSYLFELQIKSKLLSAWGDMEHRIFYKDYLGSAVRNSVKELMNKVGFNLKSIDDLLYSIRISNSNYLLEKDFYLFMEDVQYLFIEELKKYLKIQQNFDLHKPTALLFEFNNIDKTKKDINFDNLSIPLIDESILNDEYIYLKVFENLKKYSFNIRILEFLYTAYVFDKYQQDSPLIKHNILINNSLNEKVIHASILFDFVEEYKRIIFDKFLDVSVDDQDEDQEYLNNLIHKVFEKASSEKVLMLSEHYSYIFDFYKIFKNKYYENVKEKPTRKVNIPGIEQFDIPQNHQINYYLIIDYFAFFVFQNPEERKNFLDELDPDIVEFLKNEFMGVSEVMSGIRDDVSQNEKLHELVVQFINLNSLSGSDE